MSKQIYLYRFNDTGSLFTSPQDDCNYAVIIPGAEFYYESPDEAGASADYYRKLGIKVRFTSCTSLGTLQDN